MKQINWIETLRYSIVVLAVIAFICIPIWFGNPRKPPQPSFRLYAQDFGVIANDSNAREENARGVQRAINVLDSAGGGLLIFKNGTYYLR